MLYTVLPQRSDQTETARFGEGAKKFRLNLYTLHKHRQHDQKNKKIDSLLLSEKKKATPRGQNQGVLVKKSPRYILLYIVSI